MATLKGRLRSRRFRAKSADVPAAPLSLDQVLCVGHPAYDPRVLALPGMEQGLAR